MTEGEIVAIRKLLAQVQDKPTTIQGEDKFEINYKYIDDGFYTVKKPSYKLI